MKELLPIVNEMSRSLSRFERGFETTYGIPLNEGFLLCNLNKRGPLCAGELAGLLDLNMSTLSKVLRAAENRGYVMRSFGDRDRRQIYFSLTPSGKEKIDKIDCTSLQASEPLKKFLVRQ